MKDIETLERDIARLKGLLSLAWRHLADTAMTNKERREMRNDMTLRSQALRDRLNDMDKAMLDARAESERRTERARRSVAKLRLLDAA